MPLKQHSYHTRTIGRAIGALAVAAGLVCGTGAATAADFSGVWLPAGNLDAPLSADSAPVTPKAKAALATFDPRHKDSTRFCMPYGTPRNTLSTAPYPIEILQRPERLTIIFDRLGDVRRIYLDGRKRAKNVWPTWLGNSLGHWEGDTLVVDTVAMTSESILTDDGLPHSDDMTLQERMNVIERDGGKVLKDEITITDPAMYAAPIKVARYFRRADDARMSEGSGLCLLDQWRQRLETRNKTLAVRANVSDESGGEGAGP
jgi:hypothetical protein